MFKYTSLSRDDGGVSPLTRENSHQIEGGLRVALICFRRKSSAHFASKNLDTLNDDSDDEQVRMTLRVQMQSRLVASAASGITSISMLTVPVANTA